MSIRPVKGLGVGSLTGDDLNGALHVLELQLSPPPLIYVNPCACP